MASKRLRNSLKIFLLLSPWIVSFLTFKLYPVGYSFYLSFTRYNPIRGKPPTFVGLKNYIKLFSDPTFMKALKNTLIFVVGTVPITTIIALLIAAVLVSNLNIKGKQIFQSGYFMPVVTSMVVIATIFSYLYSPYGYLTALMKFFGASVRYGRGILAEPKYALPAIMAMDIWASFGYYTILFLAGLQSINQEIYEAAAIDGAKGFYLFRKVTLPLISPMLLFVLVINTIRSFQIFIEVYVMTQGGPLKATTTIVYYLYETGFHKMKMGYAAAMSYVLFMIILAFTLIQKLVIRYQR
ncbi:MULTISPECIES: carbohydrate ABC transporter permease [Kosmotoga]|uniref:Binding-protein-dependent transport systems inner membrane component n=1 Tax=Kosmotoga olearia (strain ATCC BAA-1733 / DSM 21960 / TBF 19.5.1) TaxID=521045 RepID=C5CGK1_KOSOT|nr:MULTISPECIES: sugar ABC transporter permease [Kosmotoga]ACR79583.1 binding-protein-dependent transport systems inner membrane component [Kosmotoga olearia TBF 19.5.1]MDI3524441.1 multiple sugar transport system permease protein [Kosmotoga sp.]MDK2954254.1 multiple sugar transport system permease protein [Kosmotoga sp.]OAA22132.1 ABC transporter permease [Kosmotoga sp. DU53]